MQTLLEELNNYKSTIWDYCNNPKGDFKKQSRYSYIVDKIEALEIELKDFNENK